MSDWERYQSDRLIKRCNDYVVIKPRISIDVIPLSCDVCEYLMTTRDDVEAYLEFKCCNHCAMTWAHPRRDEWKNGWRPTDSDVEKALANRSNLYITFDCGDED